MRLETMLLVCKQISNAARGTIIGQGCEIFRNVPGLEEGLEIVELQYAGDDDLNMLSQWGIPQEIEIYSRDLILLYESLEDGSYKLRLKDDPGDEVVDLDAPTEYPFDPHYDPSSDLGDLDDHPF